MPRLALTIGPALRRALLAALATALPTGCVTAEGTPQAGPAVAPAVAAAYSVRSASGSYLAGRHAQATRDVGAAATFYGQALAITPDDRELLQRAFALTAAGGRIEEAAGLAEKLVTGDAEDAIAVVLLAVRDAREGRWEAAEKRLEALPRRGLSSFMAPLLTAWARVGRGEVEAGLEGLRPLAENSHLAPIHDFHAALIADLAERRKVAEEYYAAILATPGGASLRAVQAVGAFYQRIGRPEKAAEVYARYRDEHPDSALLDPERLLAAGVQARRPVDSALSGMAEALFGAASSVRQSNAPEMAMLFGHMALHLQPDFALARILVADLLQSQDRLDEANAMYGAIPVGSPVYASAQLRMAGNFAERGEVDRALDLLARLAAAQPDRTDALVTMGEILRQHERFVEAAAAYDNALARMSEVKNRHWPLFYSRGISLERSKQWQRAESDFLRALELEPDQPYVLNYLGYSWVEQGINLDQAQRMIEKAVELRPHDGYIVDSLGWVLYRLGRYDDAVTHLERAVELRPEDPTINDHLGDALWKVGRHEEARFQWTRALGLKPEPNIVEDIESKLAAGLGERTAADAAIK